MKKTTLVLIFIGISFLHISQIENIVINPSMVYMNVYDIEDTLISSYSFSGCGSKSYKMDIDNNSVTDLTFGTTCYAGGMGGSRSIALAASDSCYFVKDTNVIDSIGSISPSGQIVYTPAIYSMVKKFELDDTISIENCIQQAPTQIVYYNYGNFPSLILYNSLDSWISGEHYIGFRKRINQVNYLGWIKLSVPDYYTFIIKEYALVSECPLGFQFPVSFLDSPIKVYPNPVVDRLSIQWSYQENAELTVFNVLGSKVFETKLEKGLNSIDFSDLNPGLYAVQITSLDFRLQKQIVKL
ncbi:MAG: T9SS C-terminal target domain-containing protein [Flavobacteriia bacterium]|nr:T9SS C-terminal target domain-containing protein [Flavobacteriia bacterium]